MTKIDSHVLSAVVLSSLLKTRFIRGINAVVFSFRISLRDDLPFLSVSL